MTIFSDCLDWRPQHVSLRYVVCHCRTHRRDSRLAAFSSERRLLSAISLRPKFEVRRQDCGGKTQLNTYYQDHKKWYTYTMPICMHEKDIICYIMPMYTCERVTTCVCIKFKSSIICWCRESVSVPTLIVFLPLIFFIMIIDILNIIPF